TEFAQEPLSGEHFFPPPAQPRGRYLLGYAVDVATPEQDLARGNSNDAAIRKQSLQLRHRRAVAARIEQRHDDAAVGNVEVDIAGGKALTGLAPLAPLPGYDTRRLPLGNIQ